MQTMKLFAYQQPSRVEMLLDGLVYAQHLIPSGARPISEHSDLPSVLQKVVFHANKNERVWRAWNLDEGIWFFTAEMSLPLSRERGCPALQVWRYSEAGAMQEWRLWVCLKDGSWQQCTL